MIYTNKVEYYVKCVLADNSIIFLKPDEKTKTVKSKIKTVYKYSSRLSGKKIINDWIKIKFSIKNNQIIEEYVHEDVSTSSVKSYDILKRCRD